MSKRKSANVKIQEEVEGGIFPIFIAIGAWIAAHSAGLAAAATGAAAVSTIARNARGGSLPFKLDERLGAIIPTETGKKTLIKGALKMAWKDGLTASQRKQVKDKFTAMSGLNVTEGVVDHAINYAANSLSAGIPLQAPVVEGGLLQVYTGSGFKAVGGLLRPHMGGILRPHGRKNW